MNNLVELNKEELGEIDGGWFGALIKEVMRSAIVGQMIDAIGEISIDWDTAGASMEASGFAHQGANK